MLEPHTSPTLADKAATLQRMEETLTSSSSGWNKGLQSSSLHRTEHFHSPACGCPRPKAHSEWRVIRHSEPEELAKLRV